MTLNLSWLLDYPIILIVVTLLTLLASFLLSRTHLLASLLILELILLTVATTSPFMFTYLAAPQPQVVLLLLTLSACDAAVGLALLVLLVRSQGNDYLNALAIHH